MANEPQIGGIDLKFYESFELESQSTENSVEKNLDIVARNLHRTLMMGWNPKWRELVSWRTIRGTFFRTDHEIAKSIRGAFQLGLTNIYDQLKNAQLTEPQLNQAKVFINTCLMYLGYFETNPYEIFSIPKYIDEKWTLVDYKATLIELTPSAGFAKWFYSEADRVWAIGLEPFNNEKATSHLIIPGTTYPQGQGFFTTLDNDLDPFKTPGDKLYNYGKQKLHAWIDNESLKGRSIEVTGTSLGGAISLLLACDKGDKFSRVDVLNPPGIYTLFKRPKVFANWDTLIKKPLVNILHQGTDIISEFGQFHPDWHLYHVIAPTNKSPGNAIADHIVNYTGLGPVDEDDVGTQFIPIDVNSHNNAHKIRNFFWYSVIRALFSFLVFKPFRYLVLPLIRFINNHVLNNLFALPLLVLTAIFALSVSPPLLVVVLTGAIYLLTRTFNNSSINVSDESNIDSSKRRYINTAIITASLLLVVASSLITFFIPVTTALLVAILIPVVTAICDKIIKMTSQPINRNEDTPGIAHLAHMPRHEELCAYRNHDKATFTYKELFEYYKYRQLEVKKYPALSGKGKSSGLFIVEQHNHLGEAREVIKSKSEILEDSKNPQFHNKLVTRVASKAKLIEMKNFMFFKQHSELSTSSNLKKNYDNYISGKKHIDFARDVDIKIDV